VCISLAGAGQKRKKIREGCETTIRKKEWTTVVDFIMSITGTDDLLRRFVIPTYNVCLERKYRYYTNRLNSLFQLEMHAEEFR
jgi:hypothetical protein